MHRLAVPLLALVVGGATAGALYLTRWGGGDIQVRVRGVEETVSKGSTLAEAIQRFGVRAPAGDLLDVEGAVLRAGSDPGQVLLNGRVAPRATQLHDGDRISVVPGQDRREPVRRVTLRVPGGMPADPQFTLARTPGVQLILRGHISHKIVPLTFRPTGGTRAPKAVALTFDDGPSRYTHQVLDVLHRLQARATFFVIGYLAERYPRLVRRELAAGMGVGNHTYSHPFLPPFDRRSHARIRAEIGRGTSVLSELGATVTMFRPPGGSFSPYVLEATGSDGLRIVLWSVDPGDWKRGATASRITRAVLAAVRPGSIILLHDGGGNRSQTVKALPAIIRGIRHKGLKLVLVDGHS